MGEQFLAATSLFRCTFGTVPMTATPSKKNIKMDGMTVMSSGDKNFVKSFGVCAVTKLPCSPKLTEWIGFVPNISFKGCRALTKNSFIMCGLGGKVAPQTTGQRTARNEAEKVICPLCGKSHLEHKFVISGCGNSVGDDGALGTNMQSPFKHEWGVKFNGANIAAHHLICQSLVNDAGDWAQICYVYDYDINKKENGVYLPNKLSLACHLGVPLHFKNHGSGFAGSGYDIDRSGTIKYVDLIDGRLEQIYDDFKVKNKEPCPEEHKDGFIAAMDALSKETFDNIETFNWTLTFDGINYKPGNHIGCGNKTMISEKQDDIYEVQEKIGGAKSEVNGFKLTKENIKRIREVRDAVLNNFLAPCGCGRIHQEYIELGIMPNQKIKYGGTY